MRAAARADGRDLAGHMKARSSKERKLASCQALYRAYESLSNDSAHGQDHYQQLLRAASGTGTKGINRAPACLQSVALSH